MHKNSWMKNEFSLKFSQSDTISQNLEEEEEMT